MKKNISLLLVFTLISPSLSFGSSLGELRSQAKLAFQAGDYSTASSLYQQIVGMEPQRVDLMKEAMWALWNMGKSQAAHEMAQAIQKISPDDSEAAKISKWAPEAINQEKIKQMKEEAKTAYQDGNIDRSIDLYRQMSEMAPQNAGLLRDYMWVLWNAKRTEKAVEMAQKLLVLKPEDRDANSVLERAPQRVARVTPTVSKDAAQSLKDKIEKNPENLNAQRQLLWLLYNRKQFGEARELLRKIVNVESNDAEFWYQIGKVQLGMGDSRGAVASFTKSIALNPNQPNALAVLGKMYIQDRDLDQGVKYLGRAVELKEPGYEKYLPVLGKALFYRGDYRRSAEAWTEAVTAFPGKPNYQFHEAEAMFYSGDQGLALDKMRRLKLVEKEPLAMKFLIDYAIARKDDDTAIELLEENLEELTPTKGRDVIRLSHIFIRHNRLGDALALIRRWLTVAPDDIPGLMHEARILRRMNRPGEAQSVAKRILQLNPYSIDAQLDLAETYFDKEDFENGLKSYVRARELDPTTPYMISGHGIALFRSGKRREGRQMLLDWISKNSGEPAVPILLYHGLSPIDSAPMLANPIHMTIAAFEGQMKALFDAGYHPITVKELMDWHSGKSILPEKPVLISFDDARMDAFRFADPILEKYGLKATMFIPIVNIDSSGAVGYASWPTIKKFYETDRWEIQSHGADAHTEITINAEGKPSRFLVMPQWLKKEGRSETRDEWEARIEKDHEECLRAQKAQLGYIPIGYAYPEGLYGQQSASQDAVPVNLEAVKKKFQAAFIQDQYGVNVRTQDPYFFQRVEPKAEWSGKDLLRHLSDSNPHVLMSKALVGMALEENKISEAEDWLENIKKMGGSNNMVLFEQARITYASGHPAQAYQLALQSFAGSNVPYTEIEEALRVFKSRSGLFWRPGGVYEKDSQHRERWVFEQELGIPIRNRFRARLLQGVGRFLEDGQSTVKDSILGVGFNSNWADGQEVEVTLRHHSLSGQSDDLLALSGIYRARWADTFRTRFDIGRGLYGSARAVNANVRENRYRAQFHWGLEEEWGLTGQGRLSSLTGENRRKRFEGTLAWLLFRKIGLGPVYRFLSDDMKNLSLDYYSPQNLITHQGGPQWVIRPHRTFEIKGRYLVGSAKEDNTKRETVETVDGAARWQIRDKTTLRTEVTYEENPNYHGIIYSLGLEHYF